MADFTPTKHTANEYNNGVQYVGDNPAQGIVGDDVQAQTINNLVESALYTQNLVEQNATDIQEAKDIADSAVGIANDALDKISGIGGLYVCNNGSGVTIKKVVADGFQLITGARITVKFTNANNTSSPALNVNDTGGIAIKADGDATYVKWLAGAVMDFVYDGTNWVVVGGYPLQGMRVGTIYQSNNSTSPATLYGGSWTAITSGYYLKAITSGTPAYENAGLPNIEGTIRGNTDGSNIYGFGQTKADATGAFYWSGNLGYKAYGSASSGATNRGQFILDASAYDSIYGDSDTVTPLNRGAYMWYRTA